MAPSNDPKALGPAPIRTPIVASNGDMTYSWSQWFQVLYQRVGGGYNEPLSSLTKRVDDLNTRVDTVETNVSALQGEVSSLDTRTTSLEVQVADLENRVGNIETLLNTGFTGTITTAALTPIGSQGSMTFDRGVLVGQSQAT